MYAADFIGMKEIPAIVRDMTDDEAVIFMVDSNLQREEILPSERAKAYGIVSGKKAHTSRKKAD